MKRYLASVCIFVFAFMIFNATAIGQQESASVVELEKNLDLMRKDLRSEKKKLIAFNVPLTATEATKFWPVYDQYAAEMSKHYDQFYSLIKEYAANQKTLTDAQASSMIKRWSTTLVDLAQTRVKHVALVEKVLPGKKAALFFQIDRRLYALLDLQIASEVPLVLQ